MSINCRGMWNSVFLTSHIANKQHKVLSWELIIYRRVWFGQFIVEAKLRDISLLLRGISLENMKMFSFHHHLCGAGKKTFCYWRSFAVCSFSFFRCTWGLMRGRPRSHEVLVGLRRPHEQRQLYEQPPGRSSLHLYFLQEKTTFCFTKKYFWCNSSSLFPQALVDKFSPSESIWTTVNRLKTEGELQKQCWQEAILKVGGRLKLETMWLQFWRRQWSQSRAPRLR